MDDNRQPTESQQAVAQAQGLSVDPAHSHVSVEWKHESPLICCRFEPQAEYVFASAEDNTVQRWDLASGQKVALVAHDSWVRGIAFSADGEIVVTAGCDGRLIWWQARAEKPAPIRTLDAHQGWIRSISTSPDGQWLASGGNDNVLKLWDISDGKLLRQFTGHTCHVYSTWFHPAGEFVLSGDLKGEVRQWNVTDGSCVRTFDAKALHSYNGGQQVDFGGVRSMAVAPDGRHFACSGLHKATNPLGAVHEPITLLFDWDSQKLVQSYIAEGIKGVAWRVLFHADGYLIGVSGGSSGGFLLFWKPDQKKEFHRFKLPNLARDLDLHPDGLQLATAHYDSHLRITKMSPKPAS